MNEQEWIKQLKQEGFKEVAVCPIGGSNAEFGEHTHHRTTVHVILEGELTLIPARRSLGAGGDQEGKKTLRQGERFEIPAGTTHRAKCGPQGCRFIVGVKED